MQSSSIRFLQGHDFKMEKPFTIGVPYLSRHEEAQVREKVAGINSNPKPRFWKISNPAKREFTAKIKTTILEWLEMEVRLNELTRRSLLLKLESRKSQTFLISDQSTTIMPRNRLVGLLKLKDNLSMDW